MNTRKREGWLVVGLLLIAVIAGLCITLSSPTAHVEYAQEALQLHENDFSIRNGTAVIRVGTDTLTRVERDFGKGRFLGMSTVYEPPSRDFRLRFPKKQDTVWIFDTTRPGFYTARGIQIGDGIDKVIQAYGEHYSKVMLEGNDVDYDLVYGSYGQGTITFHCHHGVVTRIVVSRDPGH